MAIDLPYKFQNLDTSQMEDAKDSSGDKIGKVVPASYLDANFTALANAIEEQLGKTIVISSTSPADPVAGMFWIDTTNMLLKIRNPGNTDWQAIWDFANQACAGNDPRLSGQLVYRESEEIYYTANTILSWTPSNISRVIYPYSYLVCKTSDRGYAVEQKVYGWAYDDGSATRNAEPPIFVGGTTIYLATGDKNPLVVLNSASAQADWFEITSRDYWRLVFGAICLP
mgnify:CR=1 FL=1